jgi:predicted phage tail protein
LKAGSNENNRKNRVKYILKEGRNCYNINRITGKRSTGMKKQAILTVVILGAFFCAISIVTFIAGGALAFLLLVAIPLALGALWSLSEDLMFKLRMKYYKKECKDIKN